MRMTRQQFDTAVDLLQRKQQSDSEIQARVIAAALSVISHRRGITDDNWPGSLTPELMTELSEFLSGLDNGQRKKLKSIADSLIMEKTPLH